MIKISSQSNTLHKWDPLIGLNKDQISNLLIQSSSLISNNNKLTNRSKYYLDALYEFTTGVGEHPTLFGYLQRTANQELADLVDGRVNKGHLSIQQAQKIRQLIQQGQNSKSEIINYLTTLVNQTNNIIYQKPVKSIVRTNLINIRTLSNSNMLLFDIGKGNNQNFLDLIATDIINFINENNQISLVVDNVSFESNSAFEKMLTSNMNLLSKFLIFDDICYYFNYDQIKINRVLGATKSLLLSRHSNATSADIFSNFFGKYEKKELIRNAGISTNHSPMGNFFGTGNNTENYHIEKKDKSRLEASMIQSMDNNQLVYFNANENFINVYSNII